MLELCMRGQGDSAVYLLACMLVLFQFTCLTAAPCLSAHASALQSKQCSRTCGECYHVCAGAAALSRPPSACSPGCMLTQCPASLHSSMSFGLA
jgi:hypothetical protein